MDQLELKFLFVIAIVERKIELYFIPTSFPRITKFSVMC